MSLNIPGELMSFVEGGRIDVPISLNKFGPTQFKSLLKMIRTGVIHGYGVPAQIASRIRREYNQPIAGFSSNDYVCWENCNEDDTAKFLPQVKGAALATFMMGETTHSRGKPTWWTDSEWNKMQIETRERKKEAIAELDTHSKRGQFNGVDRKFARFFTKVKLSTAPEVEAIAKSIEDGTTAKYHMPYPNYH
jgi:hypothetical protein